MQKGVSGGPKGEPVGGTHDLQTEPESFISNPQDPRKGGEKVVFWGLQLGGLLDEADAGVQRSGATRRVQRAAAQLNP